MFDLAEIQNAHLILQPIGGLIDQLRVLVRNAVGVRNLKSIRSLFKVDVNRDFLRWIVQGSPFHLIHAVILKVGVPTARYCSG